MIGDYVRQHGQSAALCNRDSSIRSAGKLPDPSCGDELLGASLPLHPWFFHDHSRSDFYI